MAEDRLYARIFTLEQECASLKREYDDVVGKNRRYRDKDDQSEKKKAKLRAELARVETIGFGTLQQLKDTGQEVTQLSSRNSELEAFCRQQSEQILDGEMCLDEVTQALTELTLHIRRRPRHDNAHNKQGDAPDASKPPTTKLQHEQHQDNKMPSLDMCSPPLFPTKVDHSTASTSGPPKIRQRPSTGMTPQPSLPPRKYTSTETHPPKRALSSDSQSIQKNTEKRRKDDHTQSAPGTPQQRATDPRLQAGRR